MRETYVALPSLDAIYTSIAFILGADWLSGRHVKDNH